MTVLASRAERLGPAFDLLAGYHERGFFFERAGLGVAAGGEAARVRAEAGPERIVRLARELSSMLGAVERHPEAPAPVAVASIPFDDRLPAEAVVPAKAAVRSEAGETWQIEVVAAGGAAHPHGPRERWAIRTLPHQAFAPMQLRPDPEPDEYERAVVRATERIRAGELRKVVLARTMLVDAGRVLDPKQLLWRLRAVDPDCYAFAAPQLGTRSAVLVGATPELLLRRRGRVVEATPLAGSSQRFGDQTRDRASADRLFASEKDREEHAVVVEDVARILGAFCDAVEHPHEPELLGTANVWHLATPFSARLHDPSVSALELVAALHPTAAVAGSPREPAREALEVLEPVERGGYAGPVGWVDANGDGEWAIALRCAEIAGTTARLFAGAGIVAGSVPEAELEETERKFRALLDALRWS